MVVVVSSVVVVGCTVCRRSWLALLLRRSCCCLTNLGSRASRCSGRSRSSGSCRWPRVPTIRSITSTCAVHCLRGRMKCLCLLGEVLSRLCLSLSLLSQCLEVALLRSLTCLLLSSIWVALRPLSSSLRDLPSWPATCGSDSIMLIQYL